MAAEQNKDVEMKENDEKGSDAATDLAQSQKSKDLLTYEGIYLATCKRRTVEYC